MTKEQAFKEIEEKYGFVLSVYKALPENLVGLEWESMKRLEEEKGAIDIKYLHLVGLGIAGATKSEYAVVYHTEMARAYGATDAEIEAVALFAKMTLGWSGYVDILKPDFDKFRGEIHKAAEHLHKKGIRKAA